jgi:hypothetical protein
VSGTSLEGVNCSQEIDMEATTTSVAVLAAIFVAIFVAVFLPIFLSGERAIAAQERARARRLAEARMNARLLRLNI